jgi:hypothetical protein
LNRPIKKDGIVVGYKSCGRVNSKDSKDKYPLCRPSKKVSSKTPRTYKSISKASISKAKKQKAKVKGTQFGSGSVEDTVILSIVGVISFGLMSIFLG